MYTSYIHKWKWDVMEYSFQMDDGELRLDIKSLEPEYQDVIKWIITNPRNKIAIIIEIPYYYETANITRCVYVLEILANQLGEYDIDELILKPII